jgi:hypothetical protein
MAKTMAPQVLSCECTGHIQKSIIRGKIMKFSLRAVFMASSMAVLLAAAPLAHADIFSAIVYQGIPDPNNAADVANQGSGLASASFSIGALGIDFRSPPAAYTVASFLNNPTFSNQVHGFNPSGIADNLELVITGSLFLNAGSNSLVVGHDDGAVLNIAGFGNVVNAPGPTSFSTSPFTVNAPSAGMYNFSLEYTECCGAPADLEFTVNNAPVTSTPEPSSIALFGTGLFAAAGMVRRRIFS